MKPLPLAFLILAAALASWWLFGTEEVAEPTAGSLSADDGASTADSSTPPKSTGEAADTGSAEPGGGPAQPTEPAGRSRLPLGNKFIEQATWTEAEALVVLEEVAMAARRGLRVSSDARTRLDSVRITLDLGRASVRQVLELLTRPYDLAWNVSGGVIFIEDDER